MRRRIEADLDGPPAAIPTGVLNEVFAHAREADPEECCGLILGTAQVRHQQVVRCRNDMTAWHQRDPETYPRDGTQGFYMRELDYMHAEEEARACGQQITCVYHSHVECGAYFSEMDQDFALQDLFPFPDAEHLVVAVIGGKVVDQSLFRRVPPGDRFVGRPVVHARP